MSPGEDFAAGLTGWPPLAARGRSPNLGRAARIVGPHRKGFRGSAGARRITRRNHPSRSDPNDATMVRSGMGRRSRYRPRVCFERLARKQGAAWQGQRGEDGARQSPEGRESHEGIQSSQSDEAYNRQGIARVRAAECEGCNSCYR